jgi:hypothetical protein
VRSAGAAETWYVMRTKRVTLVTFRRYFPLLLMLSGAGCGEETSAARAPASLACQAHDGRCVVCFWEENGSPRCRITIFSGSCPAGASPAGSSCPPGPVASCDRSTPGYLDGQPGSGDVDFYYGSQDLTHAENDCAASESLISNAAPTWTVYE